MHQKWVSENDSRTALRITRAGKPQTATRKRTPDHKSRKADHPIASIRKWVQKKKKPLVLQWFFLPTGTNKKKSFPPRRSSSVKTFRPICYVFFGLTLSRKERCLSKTWFRLMWCTSTSEWTSTNKESRIGAERKSEFWTHPFAYSKNGYPNFLWLTLNHRTILQKNRGLQAIYQHRYEWTI